ncbi:MAG: hypothetical protein ACKO37_06385 [Vampirovibrionales bacterium]
MQRFEIQNLRTFLTLCVILLGSVASVLCLPPLVLQWVLKQVGLSMQFMQALWWWLLALVGSVWALSQVVTLTVRKVKVDEETEAFMAFPVVSPSFVKRLGHVWPFSAMMHGTPSAKEMQTLAQREELALQRLMRRQEALRRLKELEALHHASSSGGTTHASSSHGAMSSDSPSEGMTPVDWQRWKKEPLPQGGQVHSWQQHLQDGFRRLGIPQERARFLRHLSSPLGVMMLFLLGMLLMYHAWVVYAWEWVLRSLGWVA